MRPVSGMIAVLVGLALLMVNLAPAAAQEATPAQAGEAGEGFEPLAFGVLEELPPAPALFALLRISYEPGAGLPAIPLPGPLVGVIEAGTFTAQPDGPVEVHRATAAATPGAVEAATPGGDLTLEPGDQIVTPAGTGVAYLNAGTEPGSALVAGVLPADATLPTTYPPGVTVQFLAAGVFTELPTAPAALGMVRLTYAPGQADPEPSENFGPLLAYVEQGTIGYTLAAGEAQVVRGAAGAATPVAAATPEAVVLGSEVTLVVGDAVVEQGGASSSARNPGDEPAVVVLAVLGPPEAFAEEGAATPAATPAA